MHHALHSSALWQTVLVVTVSKAIRVMSRWPIGPWVVGAQPSWLGAPPPPCFGRWQRDPPDGGVSINHLGYPAYICTPLCTSINQSIHSLQSTLLTWYHELGFLPCSFRCHSAPFRLRPQPCAPAICRCIHHGWDPPFLPARRRPNW